MQSIWLTPALIASLLTFPQTANSFQAEGAISGTVLDEHGQPFKGMLGRHLHDGHLRDREKRVVTGRQPQPMMRVDSVLTT